MSDHKPIAPECLMSQAEELSRRQSNELCSLAATAGSAQRRIEIQNALRALSRVVKVDEEIIYCGNDLWLIRDHLYRSQEACELLVPNAELWQGERK